MSLRTQKTARKKEKILQSALTVLAEKGYHGTTMEDIASHLLMTKGSLYYYFKDKQELVYESQVKLLNQSIENVKTISEAGTLASDKLIGMIRIHTKYLIKNQSGFELMNKPEDIFSEEQLQEIFRLREQYAEYYDKILAEGVEDGSFTIQEDEIKIVRNIILGALNWVTQWYSPQGYKSINDFVEAITKYVLRIVDLNEGFLQELNN